MVASAPQSPFPAEIGGWVDGVQGLSGEVCVVCFGQLFICRVEGGGGGTWYLRWHDGRGGAMKGWA